MKLLARSLMWVLGLAAFLLSATASQATTPPIYLVLFATDDVALDDTQRAALDQAITDLRTIDQAQIKVEGHYDRTGTPEHRVQMSRRFAEAVTNYFVANGISKETIAVSSRGDEELAVPTAEGVYELANRYVVVMILPK